MSIKFQMQEYPPELPHYLIDQLIEFLAYKAQICGFFNDEIHYAQVIEELRNYQRLQAWSSKKNMEDMQTENERKLKREYDAYAGRGWTS